MAPLSLAAPTPTLEPEHNLLPREAAKVAPAAVTPTEVGSAIVKNNCGFDIHLVSVSSTTGPEQIIRPGNSYSERFRPSSSGAGTSLKIGRSNPLAGGSIIQFEYAISNTLVYYDLSAVNGDPFSGYYRSIDPAISTCARITCPANQNPCSALPGQHSATQSCSAGGNLVFNIC